MTFDEIIRSRRSIRVYRDEIPDDRLVTAMLESASFAPSPSHSQPVRFILIRSQHLKDDLHRAPRLAQRLAFQREQVLALGFSPSWEELKIMGQQIMNNIVPAMTPDQFATSPFRETVELTGHANAFVKHELAHHLVDGVAAEEVVEAVPEDREAGLLGDEAGGERAHQDAGEMDRFLHGAYAGRRASGTPFRGEDH